VNLLTVIIVQNLLHLLVEYQLMPTKKAVLNSCYGIITFLNGGILGGGVPVT